MAPVTNMSHNVALITGGAKGIGHGIALDLAARQWNVAISIEPVKPRRRRPLRPAPWTPSGQRRAILFQPDRRHAPVTRETAEDKIGMTWRL